MENENCVAFMNSKTRKELTELPDDAVVISELIEDGTTVVVPTEEFVKWLYNGGCGTELIL